MRGVNRADPGTETAVPPVGRPRAAEPSGAAPVAPELRTMPVSQHHRSEDDFVDLVCRAVAKGDGPALDVLLAVLEVVADEPLLDRLDAAMGRHHLPGQGPQGGTDRPVR
ncbi:hypothetical protein GCM10010441_21640 [Kitasatospora paracochleata]